MGKHRKKAKARGFWKELRARLAAAYAKTLGPKEQARASMEWNKGEYVGLRPVLQPYPWRHYVAPEDIERYAASIGGYEFVFELLPESGHELERAAYDAAAEHWGVFVDSLPLDWIAADNDRAREVLPAPIS